MDETPMTIAQPGISVGAVPADLTDEDGAPEALAAGFHLPASFDDGDEPIDSAIFAGLVTP